MPPPYRLRALRDENGDAGDGGGDAAFAAALYSSTRGDLRQMPADPAMIEQLIAMQRQAQIHGYRQSYPDALYLLLQRGETPIGRLVLNCEGKVLHLVDIAILPEAQGQGAASAALGWLQALATAEQLRIALNVRKSNLGARQLYQRMGFRLLQEDALQEQLAWNAA